MLGSILLPVSSNSYLGLDNIMQFQINREKNSERERERERNQERPLMVSPVDRFGVGIFPNAAAGGRPFDVIATCGKCELLPIDGASIVSVTEHHSATWWISFGQDEGEWSAYRRAFPLRFSVSPFSFHRFNFVLCASIELQPHPTPSISLRSLH